MPDSSETADAELVDQGIRVLLAGDLEGAEALFRDVVTRTPTAYEQSRFDGKMTAIKFWTRNDFVYYVQWHNAHGSGHQTSWIPNAYPRAYYHLGFIHVKLGRFDQAAEFLKSGAKLEPSNPKFKFELAKALVSQGEPLASASLYLEVVREGLGPYVSPLDMAMAYRGCGFALIELNQLGHARDAYEQSLKFDPDGNLARAQLEYVDGLAHGAAPGVAGTAQVEAPDLTQCRSCGARGRGGSIRGLTFTCDQCSAGKKPWWAFWRD